MREGLQNVVLVASGMVDVQQSKIRVLVAIKNNMRSTQKGKMCIFPQNPCYGQCF